MWCMQCMLPAAKLLNEGSSEYVSLPTMPTLECSTANCFQCRRVHTWFIEFESAGGISASTRFELACLLAYSERKYSHASQHAGSTLAAQLPFPAVAMLSSISVLLLMTQHLCRCPTPTSLAYSRAVAFVSMSTPAFATQYGSMVFEGAMPPSDDTFTMQPLLFLKWGSTTCD